MANSSAGKSSSGCMKIGCAALVVIGIALGYLVLFVVKPIITPPPIVEKLPADTVAVVSINAYNGIWPALDYRNAIGADRIKKIFDMLKSDKEEGAVDMGEVIGKIIKHSWRWAASEIVITVGSLPANPEDMPYAGFIISSRNIKAAEKNIPDIIKIAEDVMIKKTAEAEGVTPEEIEMPPMVFDSVEYGGTSIHCQEYDGVKAEDAEPGLCWTSTKGMLAVTMTRAYAKKIVDSSMGKEPAADKLAKLQKSHVPGNAILYVLVNGQQVKDYTKANIDDKLFEMVENEEDIEPLKELILGEVDAFDGLLMTFGFEGLDPQMKTSILLDPDKAAASKFLGKLVKFEAGTHAVDELVSKPGSIASVSINNLDKMASAAIETLKEESPEDYEQLAQGLKDDNGIDLEKVAQNIGPELALSLNTLKMNEVCTDVEYCEMPFMPYMLAAVQVVDAKFFQSIIDDMIAQMDEPMVEAGECEEGEECEEEVAPAAKPMLEKKSEGLYTFVMPSEDESEFSPELKPAIAFGDGFILAGTNVDDVEKCLKEKCGQANNFVSNVKVSVTPSGTKEVADAYMAANREYADDPDMQKKIDDMTLKIFDIFGVTHYLGIKPAEISINLQIHVDKDALAALPLEDLVAPAAEGEEAAEEEPEAEEE